MLSNLERNVIIGTTLGDGFLERNGKNCRLRIQHSITQKPFVCFKHQILKAHSLSIKSFAQYDKRTGKTYQKVAFDTKTLSCFNEFKEQFYVNKEKRVPKNIINLLCDPLALAVWYLDDGALRVDSKAFRLHTNSFPLCDVLVLKEVLLKNFNILSNLHRQENLKPKIENKLKQAYSTLLNDSVQESQDLSFKEPNLEKNYCLHIGALSGQAESFSKLIKPLVSQNVPSMLYKFF